MHTDSTQPAPLGSPDERRPRTGFGPLRWLRSRWREASSHRAGTPPTMSPAMPSVGRGQALRTAHLALAAVFERQPELRMSLPHLSLLEKALARHGSRALHRLPEVMVQRSLEQLAIVQRSNDKAMLDTLRVRLLECSDLCTLTPLPYAISMRSPLPEGLDVQEASHSDFTEAERRWSGGPSTRQQAR